MRPSLLLGKRKEFRLGELIGKGFMLIFSPLMVGKLKKYKPIHARQIAKAMVNITLGNYKKHCITFESDEIMEIALKDK